MPIKINWPAVGSTILPNVGGIAGKFSSRPNMNFKKLPYYLNIF